MKKLSFIFLFWMLLWSMPGKAQESQIAQLQGLVTEISSNTRFIFNNWDTDLPYFSDAEIRYNSLHAQYVSAIHYLTSYASMSKRNKKRNRAQVTSVFSQLAEQTYQYSQYIAENNSKAIMSDRGNNKIKDWVSRIVNNQDEIRTVAESILDWVNQRRNARIEELINQITAIELKSWKEYYFE